MGIRLGYGQSLSRNNGGGGGIPYDYTVYEWALSWRDVSDTGASGKGQFRDIDVAADGTVVAAGGQRGYTGTPAANLYLNTGGSAGSGGVLNACLYIYSPDGTLQDVSEIGATLDYSRAYGVAVNGDYAYMAGRTGGLHYTYTATGSPYQATFAGDSNPNSFYGNQDGFISQFLISDGTLVASTYVGYADGDLIRHIDIGPDGTLHCAFSRYGSGTPVISNLLVRVAADLKSVIATWDPLNSTNTAGGTPSVEVVGGYAYYQVSTTVAMGVGATSGAYDETFGAGRGNQYIAKLAIGASSYTLVAATYIKDAVASLSGETHSLSVLPNGDIVIVAEVTTGSSLPVTADAFQSTPHAGAGSTAGIFVLSNDLTTLKYCTYLDGGTSGESTTIDGSSVFRDGRFCVALTTDSTTLPVTDGSTSPGSADYAAYAVFAPTEAGSWTLEMCGYVQGQDGESRRVIFDPSTGDLLLAGTATDSGSGKLGPWIARYERVPYETHFSKAALVSAYFETPSALTTYLPAFAGSELTFAIRIRIPTVALSAVTALVMPGTTENAVVVFRTDGGGTRYVRANFMAVGSQNSAPLVYPYDRWFTCIATADFAAGTADVYIDYGGTLTKVLSFTGIAVSAITADAIFRSLSSTNYAFDVASIRMWNTHTPDGSIPTATALIEIAGDATDANGHALKVGAPFT